MWLRDQIVGDTPEQLELPFALWTRPAIKALIKERCSIEMPDRLVGKCLKRSRLHPAAAAQAGVGAGPHRGENLVGADLAAAARPRP